MNRASRLSLTKKSKLSLEQQELLKGEFLTMHLTDGRLLVFDSEAGAKLPSVGDLASIEGDQAGDGAYELMDGSLLVVEDSAVAEFIPVVGPELSAKKAVHEFRNRHQKTGDKKSSFNFFN